MKTTKKILAAAVAASTLSAVSLAPVANAEIAASVGIASSYHWRGFDLGSGTPAVSGDIVASKNGFYGGMWVSSGDTSAGTEYDLFFGYGGEVGNFSYDISYVSYIYPTGGFEEVEGPGDFSEIIVNLGIGPVSAFVYTNVTGASEDEALAGTRYAFIEGEYMYYGVAAEFGAFSALLAKHDESVMGADGLESASEANPGVTGDATHFDLSYAYNDNLSFTFSTILSSELGDGEPSPKFVVSYSMPIE